MGWSFVSAASTLTKTVTKSVTAGNLLVVCFNCGDATSNPTISDGVNTWEQVTASPTKDATNGAGVAMWSARAATTASITVTITAAPTTFNGTSLLEYSHTNGAMPSSSREDTSKGLANITGSTSANAMTTGTMVTTTDGCLIVGLINDDGTSDTATQYTAGTSTLTYTKRATGSQDPAGGSQVTYAVEDGEQTTHGSIQAAWTEALAHSAVAIQAAFKAPASASDSTGASIPTRPGGSMGPRMRRAFPQVYADTPATPVELTQSPAAPFRPGRGPGKGPMLLRRNIVWPSPVFTPDVTIALTGVQAAGAVGTLGVTLDVAMTGNAATGAVGTLTPGTSLALTGLSVNGSVGTLAPSTTVAMTGVAGTGSVGTLAPSTTVTLTGNEATVTIGTLAPSGDVTVALTGVSASALVGDLSPSGGDVVGSADTGSGGGSSLTFDEWLARHPWLRDYELRPNWYAYPPEKKKLKKQILAAAKERKRVSQQLSVAKDRSELDKLLEILNTLQERYNALQELYRAGLAAWQQSRAAEAEEEAEFMEHLINLL